MDYITQSQIRGFLLAFVAIGIMMCLLFRSLEIGLLSMLPNLAPVIFGLGIMGWLDLPLDYQRLLMAPVAIGISVDFTIHLVTRYRHEQLERGDYAECASGFDGGRRAGSLDHRAGSGRRLSRIHLLHPGLPGELRTPARHRDRGGAGRQLLPDAGADPDLRAVRSREQGCGSGGGGSSGGRSSDGARDAG